MTALPPAGRRVLAVLLAAGVLAGLVAYGDRRVTAMGGHPERAVAAGRPVPSNDFNVYWGAAGALDAPDLMQRGFTDDGRRYLYPPFLAAALRPLRPAGITVGAWTWFALAVLSVGVGTGLAVRAAVPPDAPRRVVVAAVAVAVALGGRFVSDDLGNGNANGLVLLGVAAGALACARGREGLGAVGFAFATALKVTPGLVLVAFLARRRWRAAGVFVAALAGLSVGVPALVVGPERALALHAEFLAASVSREGAARDEEPVNGSSLRAAVHRLTTDAAAREGPGAQPVRLAHWSPSTADAVWAGLAVAVLAALAAGWARRDVPAGPAGRRHVAVVDAALVVVGAALLSPVTRKAHLVTLLLPGAVLGASAFGPRPGTAGPAPGRAARVLTLAAIAASWASNPSLVGRRLGYVAWGLNLLCVATVLVGLALRRCPTPPETGPSHPPDFPPK